MIAPNITDLRGKLPEHKIKKYKKRRLEDIRSIGIHHSLTLTGSAESFARYHVGNNNWPGIAYPYVIDHDGRIYWCWDHDVITYHVGNSNKHALGICMVGDFRKQLPTKKQYQSSLWLVDYLKRQLPNVTQIKGHSEYLGYSWKSCPVIDMNKFRSDVEMSNQAKTKFKDVPNNYWAVTAIENIAEQGLMIGFEDDTFRPTEPVTREQLAVILTRLKGEN
ncbi:N-acetylmuramoyl-L-alanine amidase [Chengkuizengella sediminis]|uniref:N-acetylmuramoyl-L-alanine amidase n=1 Tax=Chengkuizengella sediminis TaxID=1885917 RepID=UPI001389472F|nr:hypothetical protein [Chengkuizengella sediminis]